MEGWCIYLYDDSVFFARLQRVPCLAGLRANIDSGHNVVIPQGLTKATILSEEACKKLPHVAMCLLEKFKVEGGINYHAINVASK